MPLTPVQPTISAGINPYVGDMAPKDEKPEMLDLWSAAASQTTPGALYQRLTMPDPDLPDAPAGWDALDNLQGYEEFASQATGIQTPSELAGWKSRVDMQRIDRDVLRRAGFGGTAAELAMMAIDPTFIASIGVPELGMAKLARSGRALYAAGRGAAEGGIYEAGMQNLQDTRTSSDMLMSVGGGALVGGVLGALTRGVSSAELRKITEAAAADINPNITAQAFGAAAVERPTTLAAESLAPGARQISALAAKTPLIATDLDVIMAGQSVRARTVLQDLANVPQMIAKNMEGIATPQSAEVNIGRWQAVVADFSDIFRRNYAAVKSSMSYEEFGTAVANAARAGDAHPVKEVAEVASFWRSKIADPLKKGAQEAGILGEVDNVVGAVSYFTRRYNREAIRANEKEWENTLYRWFSAQSDAMDLEIKAAIDDVTRKILGADVGQANFNVRINAEKAGPLKERTLDIPDELIASFLDNNPLRVAASYVNELAPQVELAKRFGDFEMKDAVSKVQNEYSILREKAGDNNAAIRTLREEEKKVLDALLRIRDRILGRAGRIDPATGDGGRRAVAASRGWRNLVTASKLGATALTGGIMDTTRIMIENGFLPTMRSMTRLAASPEFRALSKTQARRVGAAVEVALSRRVMVMYDGAITEGWTQKLSNSLYKYTGLNHIMDFNRTLACTLLEDRILKVAGQLAEGGRPRKFELARLATLGLDEDALTAISKEVGKHGGESGGMRVSGSADWGNKALADAYDNALLKESKIVVVEPGAADRVWWMDKELGKFIGQLKTFTLAAPARLTSGLASRVGTGQYGQAARFLGFMMVGGYLTHATRQLVAGKEPITDPLNAAKQAFGETGLAGVLPDLLDPLARTPLGMRVMGAVGVDPSAKRADQNAFSAYGGPSAGTAADLIDIVWNRTANGISARDLHAIRRIMPWQNAWFLRRGINAAEGELAELMQLDGYDVASAGDRVMRTDPTFSANKPAVMMAGQ
jgi:hypothetical protein